MKNEEGLVMMFILNFDYVLDEESDNSTEKISPTSPTKSDQSQYFAMPFLISYPTAVFAASFINKAKHHGRMLSE